MISVPGGVQRRGWQGFQDRPVNARGVLKNGLVSTVHDLRTACKTDLLVEVPLDDIILWHPRNIRCILLRGVAYIKLRVLC